MKEDDLSELIKSNDIGLTEEELIEIIKNKNAETDSEDEKQNQKNEGKLISLLYFLVKMYEHFSLPSSTLTVYF